MGSGELTLDANREAKVGSTALTFVGKGESLAFATLLDPFLPASTFALEDLAIAARVWTANVYWQAGGGAILDQLHLSPEISSGRPTRSDGKSRSDKRDATAPVHKCCIRHAQILVCARAGSRPWWVKRPL